MPVSRITLLKLLAALLVISILSPTSGQETKVVQDLKLWTGVEVEKTFLKDWKVSLKQEFRFKTNVSELDNFFTQGGLQYELTKNFAFEAKYRYTRNKKSNGSYENRSRYSLDIKYRGKIDFIRVYYRLRYQKGVESMNLFDKTEPYEKYLRHRLSIRYIDLRKIKPYISTEFFQLFKLYEYPEWAGFRVLGGIIYEPGDFGEFRFAFGFERELNHSYPYTDYIFRVNYTYPF